MKRRLLIVFQFLFIGCILWAQSQTNHAQLINDRFTKVLEKSDLLRKDYAWTD